MTMAMSWRPFRLQGGWEGQMKFQVIGPCADGRCALASAERTQMKSSE